MQITEALVKETLNQVEIAELGKGLTDAGWVKEIGIDDTKVSLRMVTSFPCESQYDRWEQSCTQALSAIGVESVDVEWARLIAAQKYQTGASALSGVKNIIAVASGKGGVGKSTTSVNLALALAAEGASVGILDADIYGPSQPIMLGMADAQPESIDQKRILPVEHYGVQSMSIGYLVKAEQAMVWRGPMASGALQQLLRDTQWRELDYLIIDLPPGTGDIQLTLAQKVPVTAAVVVTTPQDIALADARKAINMFEKVSVPVLGIIENMSMHICSNCGHQEHIFGSGGGDKLAQEVGADMLGSLPLAKSIRDDADSGKPSVVAAPESEIAQSYFTVARKVAASLSLQDKDYRQSFPNITITND